jgi:hypothetical protein
MDITASSNVQRGHEKGNGKCRIHGILIYLARRVKCGCRVARSWPRCLCGFRPIAATCPRQQYCVVSLTTMLVFTPSSQSSKINLKLQKQKRFQALATVAKLEQQYSPSPYNKFLFVFFNERDEWGKNTQQNLEWYSLSP